MMKNPPNAIFIFSALIAAALGAAVAVGLQPYSSTSGQYSARIVGACRGRGVCTVYNNGDQLNIINIPVTNDSGATGLFRATSLQITNNHFSGAGAAFGTTFTISGKIDTVNAPRISAVYKLADGSAGRLIAVMVTGNAPPF